MFISGAHHLATFSYKKLQIDYLHMCLGIAHWYPYELPLAFAFVFFLQAGRQMCSPSKKHIDFRDDTTH